MPPSRRQGWGGSGGDGGDVTDNYPLPGTPVLQVLATDTDDTVSSSNGVVVYSILRQTPDQPQPHMFAISGSTGVISVAAAGLVAQVSPGHGPSAPPSSPAPLSLALAPCSEVTQPLAAGGARIHPGDPGGRHGRLRAAGHRHRPHQSAGEAPSPPPCPHGRQMGRLRPW